MLVAGQKQGWQLWLLRTAIFKSRKMASRMRRHLSVCRCGASEAIAQWILGDAPFKAKLKPDYAIYTDYDQLMRLDEWVGNASWNEATDDS